MTADRLLEKSPLPVTEAHAAETLADSYGLSGEIKRLPGDRDCNFIVDVDGQALMLKIANPGERLDVLLAQQQALAHIRQWDPGLPVPNPIPTTSGDLAAAVEVLGATVPVRLTTFLPGQTVEDVGWNRQLRLDMAKTLARLDLALRSYVPYATGAPDHWQIGRLGTLRPHTVHLPGERRQFVEAWLDFYESDIIGRLDKLRTQSIHGDFNPANLIVDPSYPERLTGVIDFGDMTTAPLVTDPAIAAAYGCLGTSDPGATIAQVATAYAAHHPLTDDEVELLPLLAVSRLVQSLTISGWRASLHPGNRDYILIHAEPIWQTLRQIDAANPEQLVARTIASASKPVRKNRTTHEVLAIRNLRLSAGMRLSYDRPLRLVSGEGVWLTDSNGDRYLDGYNNVAHVGHSHPAVVAALHRQAGRLNTNTRYLVDGVGDFADRLTSLLPDPLDTVFFANSGSEANDLAWRIARTVTGRSGMVVTDNAYHGSTELTINTSPEELGHHRLPSWVHTVPAPIDIANTGLGDAITRLGQAGEKLAAFACDTVFSSDGIHTPPDGYLARVYDAVRQAGGLCIADEVQAGYGRVGPRFWGFATDAAVPDIVTIGKPMGNGHPLAAVITTRQIADQFSATGYYFSTFAGNPVSAAVGEAVLDVMEHEGLPASASRVGAYLSKELARLVADTGVNGTVRGPGLFVGLELSADNGEPDAATAARVQNEMREHRVLIGRTGPAHNVLKIRPPLVFTQRHADILLETLAEVLARGVGEHVVG